LRGALPQLSQANAVWGYLFAIGVATTVMAPTGRADRLSNDLCYDSDTEELLKHVIEFAAAGLRRLGGNKNDGRTTSEKRGALKKVDNREEVECDLS